MDKHGLLGLGQDGLNQIDVGIEFSFIENVLERMGEVRTADRGLRRTLDSLREDLSSWLARARATNALFDYLADAENTKERHRFRAADVIKDVKRQVQFLARGIEVNTDEIDRELLLPEASFAEWGAIFQNVFINAFNAMLDSERRLVQVSSHVSGKSREILLQDTGSGVSLRDAERLFEPFERSLEISPERRALGYGGTGLGLTIVRLLAERIGCKVEFVEPEPGFSTAFSLNWTETK
jgi:signal transduction histidine kinase